ncbi:Protein of unknown function DUF3292 [Phaffia rhodozyma]|uniref:Uncharacterized protein n=1 Tax=Phaffia rhodozyma TaxID=264483 RepID=A0A0F7SSF2_PHARH|nr:Protein of unknown function DUF3292 [Phaffia rhodozyma]
MNPCVKPVGSVHPSRPSSTSRAVPPPLPPRKQAEPIFLPKKSQEKQFVEGMTNEQVDVLLRRFDKQIPWVKVVPSRSPRISSISPLLDLQPSPEEEFAPEKLRSNVERLYSTVIIGSIRVVSEMIRLRSWENVLRTGTFLAIYMMAWSIHLVTASLLFFVSILVLFPSARCLLFPLPDIPSQTISTKTPSTIFVPGMTQEEQVEAQASQFATDLEELAEVGLKPSWAQDEEEGGVDAEQTQEATEAREERPSDDPKEKKPQENRIEMSTSKKTQKKKPIEKIGRPVMMICGDLADGWERWANALSPTPPFSAHEGSTRIFLTILLPLIIVATVLSDYVLSRVTSALVGICFFGQPALDQLVILLNEHLPGWQEKIELRNGVLAGCPTDAQLALRLLREAELKQTPIPPPRPAPSSTIPPSSSMSDSRSVHELKMDGSDGDFISSSLERENELDVKFETANSKEAAVVEKKPDGRNRISSFLKATARLTEESAGYYSGEKKLNWNKISMAALEKLNISPDNQAARTLLSIMPVKQDKEGPCSFLATRSGRPGWIRIDGSDITFTSVTTEPVPSLPVNTSHNPTPHDNLSKLMKEEEEKKKAKKVKPPPLPALTISANDLTAIRRFGMGGWQGRMLVGWVVGIQGVGGAGLELTIRRSASSESGVEGHDHSEVGRKIEEEVTYKFGVVRRDELFNRLISLGNQRWEIM